MKELIDIDQNYIIGSPYEVLGLIRLFCSKTVLKLGQSYFILA